MAEIPEYTVLAALSVVGVLALEFGLWRTGVLRTARFWLSMLIVGFFQVLVDGILTRLDDPIVAYAPAMMLGVRAPWDIPIEDFAFGFSMVTLAILLWERAARRTPGPDAPAVARPLDRPDRPGTQTTRRAP